MISKFTAITRTIVVLVLVTLVGGLLASKVFGAEPPQTKKPRILVCDMDAAGKITCEEEKSSSVNICDEYSSGERVCRRAVGYGATELAGPGHGGGGKCRKIPAPDFGEGVYQIVCDADPRSGQAGLPAYQVYSDASIGIGRVIALLYGKDVPQTNSEYAFVADNQLLISELAR